MKILHVVGSFVNGGIETLLVNTANRQIFSGHEVGIIVTTNKWSEHLLDSLDGRVKVFLINKPVGSKNPRFLVRILLAYHKYSPEILHLHDPDLDKLFFPKHKSEKRLVTIHNDTIPISFSRNVNRYIAISQCVYDSFVQKTGQDNCVVCLNGIDSSRFKVKKEYLGQPEKILMVGRVVFDVKGQDMVVRAVAGLPKGIREKVHLDIWGDGPDVEELRRLVSELELDNLVSVSGNRENEYVAEHLCDYDLFVQASSHEGLGLSVIEAMLSGVPVLVSDAKGLLEVSDNGKFGRIFKHSDEDSFIDNFVRCRENYAEAVCMARSAREYASSRFSMDVYVDKLEKAYLTV